MTTLRRTLVLFDATAAIAVGAIVVASVVTHGDDSPSPQHTVRDFLLDAVVDHDGMDACAYASSRSLQRLQATAPRGMSCVTAVADHAELTLGGERIATEAAVKALTYRAERQADGGERVRCPSTATAAPSCCGARRRTNVSSSTRRTRRGGSTQGSWS
jgi:hypothetical protein